MKPKPKSGQRLFLLNIGNAARRCPSVLKPATVKSVGRKYFFVSLDDYSVWTIQFHLDDWRQKTDYSTDYAIYATEQEYADEVEKGKLAAVLRETFSHCGRTRFSLETLRAVAALIDAK